MAKCCVCGHELSVHVDEGDGWRCHLLGPDGFQCECYLRKERVDGEGLLQPKKEERTLPRGAGKG